MPPRNSTYIRIIYLSIQFIDVSLWNLEIQSISAATKVFRCQIRDAHVYNTLIAFSGPSFGGPTKEGKSIASQLYDYLWVHTYLLEIKLE